MQQPSTEHAENNMVVQHDLKEIIEMLIKHHGLHEGLYDLALEFGIIIGQIGPNPSESFPGAAFGVRHIGLTKASKMGPITVNAADVNPSSTAQKKASNLKRNNRKFYTENALFLQGIFFCFI